MEVGQPKRDRYRPNLRILGGGIRRTAAGYLLSQYAGYLHRVSIDRDMTGST